MVDKARDLVARFITDTDKFDTDSPVKGLDDVADASEGATDGLDAVAKAADDAQGDLKAAGTAADGAETDVKGLGTAADGTKTDLSGMGAAADGTKTDVAGLGAAADGTKTDVTGLGTAADGTKTDLSAVGTAADGAKTDVAALGTAASGVKTDLTGVGTAAGTAKTDVTDLGTAAETAATNVDTLATAGSDAKTDVGDLATAAGDAKTDVADLGTAAEGAKAQIEAIGTSTGDAKTEVGTLADSADTSADAIVSSFDRIGDAARQRIRNDTGDAADSARGKLREVGAEGADTAREVAASFDGSTGSIADGFQEVAANAAVAFGPAGIGLGIAAASTLGILRAQAAATAERVQLLGEAIQGLNEGTETGATTVKNYLDELDPKGMDALAESARATGIDVAALAEIQSGSRLATEAEAQAIDVNVAARKDLSTQLGESVGLFDEISAATEQSAEDYEKAAGNVETYNLALGTSEISLKAAAVAEEENSARITAANAAKEVATTQYREISEAAAAGVSAAMSTSTAELEASWAEADTDIAASLAGITESLNTSTEAANNYATNVVAAGEKVSVETIKYLQTLPDGGRQAFQQLTTATDEEITNLETAVKANSVASDYAAAVVAGETGAKEAGAKIGAATRAGLTASDILTDADARAMAATAQSRLGSQTLTIGVKPVLEGVSDFFQSAQQRVNERKIGVGTVLRP